MIGYRVSSYDTPCPPSPSRRSGRWSVQGHIVVNYWSEHPYTAWAEIYRFDGITPASVATVNQRLWVGRFDHIDFIDLDEDTAAAFSLSADDLVDDDHTACQDAAQLIWDAGHRAVRVPSAALPGTVNLLLFGQRLPIAFDDDVVDPDVDIPCAVAADGSIGVPDVIRSVRYIAGDHPGAFAQDVPTPLPSPLAQ